MLTNVDQEYTNNHPRHGIMVCLDLSQENQESTKKWTLANHSRLVSTWGRHQARQACSCIMRTRSTPLTMKYPGATLTSSCCTQFAASYYSLLLSVHPSSIQTSNITSMESMVLFMYMHIYINMCVYVYIHTYIYICVYICV